MELRNAIRKILPARIFCNLFSLRDQPNPVNNPHLRNDVSIHPVLRINQNTKKKKKKRNEKEFLIILTFQEAYPM